MLNNNLNKKIASKLAILLLLNRKILRNLKLFLHTYQNFLGIVQKIVYFRRFRGKRVEGGRGAFEDRSLVWIFWFEDHMGVWVHVSCRKNPTSLCVWQLAVDQKIYRVRASFPCHFSDRVFSWGEKFRNEKKNSTHVYSAKIPSPKRSQKIHPRKDPKGGTKSCKKKLHESSCHAPSQSWSGLLWRAGLLSYGPRVGPGTISSVLDTYVYLYLYPSNMFTYMYIEVIYIVMCGINIFNLKIYLKTNKI